MDKKFNDEGDLKQHVSDGTFENDEEIFKHLRSLSTYEIHHEYTFANEEYVKKSVKCGCFDCGKIFDASEIEEDDYVKEKNGKRTALCPYCGIDSVIPDFKVELTPELVLRMHMEWFGDNEDAIREMYGLQKEE